MPHQGRLDTAVQGNLVTVLKKQANETVSGTLSWWVLRIAWI